MKKTPDHTKLRGGYYTSPDIASALIRWVAPKNGETILEPSSGDGVFLKSVKDYSITHNICNLNVIATELDPVEADKSNHYYPTITTDFFTFFRDNLHKKVNIDVLVGNPPFIRYQNFNHEYREIAFSLMRQYGFSPNKLTNIWIPFLLLGSEVLSAKGRIGMVIPAELFQVNYSAEARKYLMDKFSRLTFVLANEMLFDGAQQEIVLVLGEVTSKNPGIYTASIFSLNGLSNVTHNAISVFEEKRIPITEEKWSMYYLSNEEIGLVERIKASTQVHTSQELFDCNVGVVTGDNDYFIVDNKTKKRYSLDASKPIVTGTDFFEGIIFQECDLKKQSSFKKTWLFLPTSTDESKLNRGEKDYLMLGRSNDTPSGFKCRTRKCWFEVPVSWPPEAFFYRQVGAHPRIVLNKTNALSTDTLHKIRFKTGVDPVVVTCSMLNSFTFLCCELLGRSYGGGVLTFEPSEVRSIPIPIIDGYNPDFLLFDDLVKNDNFDELLRINDELILKKGLGFDDDDVISINLIWKKMRDRRLSRKKK